MLPHKVWRLPLGTKKTVLDAFKGADLPKDARRIFSNAKPALSLCKHFQGRSLSTSPPAFVPFLYEAAFINNELVQASDGATFPVVNPANGDVIGVVPDMGVADTEKVGPDAGNQFRINRILKTIDL